MTFRILMNLVTENQRAKLNHTVLADDKYFAKPVKNQHP